MLILSGLTLMAAPLSRQPLNNSVLALSGPEIQKVEAITAEDLGASVEFSVALQMRDFPALLARVQSGEQISRADLAANYLPTAEEYAAVAGWVTGLGLTITQRDDNNRLGLFVQGNVPQVQEALLVQFSKVTTAEGVFLSAASVPSVPEEIARVVLGLNGLQPHHHAHKHSVFQPLTNNAPPYLVGEILGAYNAANTGYNGAGETIAILIDTFPADSDLTSFWANNSIPQTLSNITKIAVIGGTLPAPSGEETLDTEWSSGIASGAKIRIYASTSLSDVDLDKSIQRIIDDLPTQPTMHQLTISLGGGETETSTSELQTDSQYFATLAAGGVSVFVSSGDSGAKIDGTLQPSYYASDPSVTGVGGTSLTLTATGTERTETAWSGSGGGISQYFSRPSWQVGAGVPAGTKRTIPDVSSVANPNTGAYVYLGGSVQQIGGTSWAAPTWAGYCAMINQARIKAGKGAIGLLNPHIYPLIGTANFRDITSGSNGAYSAGPGYDLVTGIGTPNVSTLLETLVGSSSGGGGGSGPTIASFTPTSGAAGTKVTITGTNLTGATAVEFDGVAAASFTVVSATEITATVPTGAATGVITAVTSAGSASSSTDFTVPVVLTSAPSITSFSPGSGLSGAAVTIDGANFTGATAVKFNGTAALFTVVSATQIHATVPKAATSGLISVTTSHGTADSATDFVIGSGPVNDNFAIATVIPPAGGTVVGSNVRATKQAGEPNIAGNAGGASVWWDWTAPATGNCVITTSGSSFDTLLGVYTGTAVNALSLIVANDNAGNFTVTSRVHFTAIKGTTYHIAVDGYDAATGSIVLSLAEH